jgi:hypothetical protein
MSTRAAKNVVQEDTTQRHEHHKHSKQMNIFVNGGSQHIRSLENVRAAPDKARQVLQYRFTVSYSK